MKNEVTVKVNAKINLSLNVEGKKDGYHLLDTVVASVNLADVVTACRSDAFSVSFSDEKIVAESSNAYKAAEYMTEKYSLPPVRISVCNRIPCGCGLGGSSADCAGVINALSDLFGLNLCDEEKRGIAEKFGSDTPYMLRGGYARLRGRGENVEYFRSYFSLPVIIAYRGDVNTGECFALFDKECGNGFVADNDALISDIIECNLRGICRETKNALTGAAGKLNRFVSTAEKSIDAPHFMTGSGAGVVILSQDEQLCARLERDGITVIRTEILPSSPSDGILQ